MCEKDRGKEREEREERKGGPERMCEKREKKTYSHTR
jgi:hypothetical protein